MLGGFVGPVIKPPAPLMPLPPAPLLPALPPLTTGGLPVGSRSSPPGPPWVVFPLQASAVAMMRNEGAKSSLRDSLPAIVARNSNPRASSFGRLRSRIGARPRDAWLSLAQLRDDSCQALGASISYSAKRGA